MNRHVVLVCVLACSGCAELGYRDRVLHRVASPDGATVAVCQEVPEFDGPGYDVRLERRDGTLVRRLYTVGDGDPCSELAWSPDNRVLAVLSSHVARIRFVEVGGPLADPSFPTNHGSWLQVDVSPEGHLHRGSGLRFVGAQEIELQVCPSDLASARGDGSFTCRTPAQVRRIAVPRRPA